MADNQRNYTTPEEIAAASQLSRGERCELLRRWEYDLRETAVAEEEGMGSSTPPPVTLERVRNVLRTLECGEQYPTGDHKQGGKVV